MAAIKKVLSNVAQNLSSAEKAQARANIDAASTSALANKQDRLTAGANITIQNNVVSSNPNLRIAFNDFRTSYYSVESGTTYRWTYTGGATKNKAIQEITGLDPAKTYLVIYRACLNSSQSEQCVCLNSGDSTYSFSGSDKWFKHVAESGATNYPYQHNINYLFAISGVSSCCVALVGDWSDQPLTSRAQMLNHQCQILCIG